ncbi:dTDP-4-dehydrorhamnose reductase [Mucisphaera calidilacus]|uniref:dTDP-4-dehydrorhamnose reductase n=1 Tax=Mucisphaera calidilacus TaxID=2527982 RepID=A0A518BUR6_9BACT|nr:dTDP-4-dehydrorhamnose reductase [Mucisphaera calidilacus]QDU70701.1 dTDP-4-dehydrorhamnose reductase [Mucisphaera calidilacus]
MRVLLIAPNGMLGRAWKGLLESEGVEHTAVGRPELDITRPETIASMVTPGCTHVVNCAAWTDVDGAESHEEEARRSNAGGPAALADAVRAIGARLVHYSTDYVFRGDGDAPYPVDTPRDPVSAYGRTKAEGEVLLEESGVDHLTIRTSWVYAPWGKNFVLTMRRLLTERDQVKVVDDQRGRPTSAEHLARASLGLMRADARGFFHVSDGGEATWFELARHIGDREGTTCAIEPCTTDAFPRPAKRPAYSVLDLSRTEALIGPMPDWRNNVNAVLEQL